MTMTNAELQDLVLAKASEDSEFRARLWSEPRATINKYVVTPIPDDFTVQVHEESAT